MGWNYKNIPGVPDTLEMAEAEGRWQKARAEIERDLPTYPLWDRLVIRCRLRLDRILGWVLRKMGGTP